MIGGNGWYAGGDEEEEQNDGQDTFFDNKQHCNGDENDINVNVNDADDNDGICKRFNDDDDSGSFKIIGSWQHDDHDDY